MIRICNQCAREQWSVGAPRAVMLCVVVVASLSHPPPQGNLIAVASLSLSLLL
jgi:hypothetical protein